MTASTHHYYGTAVLRPSGFGLPLSPATHKAPLSELAWCDEAGCPIAKCVHCKSVKEASK